MQHNSAETPSKKLESPENVTQQSIRNPAQFARAAYNPRFAVTPETMGINMLSDAATPNRAQESQQAQQAPPFVEVKSYYERNNNNSMVRIMADCKQDSNASFLSSQTNTPKNSFSSIISANKTEFTRQSSSPNISPNTPSQQWSFDDAKYCEYLQQNLNFPSGYNSFGPPHKPTSEPSLTSVPMLCNEQLQKYKSGTDIFMANSAQLNLKTLNDLYANRIGEIDANGWGDKDLKICTYQEWVEMLIKINEAFINNMNELERELAGRLELMHKRANSNCRHSQDNQIIKYRKDIVTLLQYIRNTPNFHKQDLQNLTFETITPSQVLEMGIFDTLTTEGIGDEIKNYNEADIVQKNKLYANMKALAHEVAEKHDEVRELKRQVICLEDEIQKAQKKIQLKDDVIKELRNDLKCASNKISASDSLSPSLVMPPINFEDQTSRSANTHVTDNNHPFQGDNGSQFDSFSHTELEEQQKIKLLDEEMSEYFELNNDLNRQKMENQRKRIMEIIEKQKLEKAAAYRKLDFIRRQLIDLESDSVERNNDSDSGFHSKSENDQDAKLLDAVRKRLRKLNEVNGDLKKQMQKLELDKNEMFNNLQSEKAFAQCSSEILKQVADLLSNMIGKHISYTEVYNTSPNKINPFCEAIIEMQNDFQEKETRLLKALGNRNKQNEELAELLTQNEKNYNEERAMHMNPKNLEDIDTTATTTTTTLLLCTTAQAQPATTSNNTEPAQALSTLSTSMTGQKLDSTTAASYH